ncbi:Dienelactone hydrolase [Sesbania bispinosa]|nr:Dienelactone hydrolase [Sesbania bispinosa]
MLIDALDMMKQFAAEENSSMVLMKMREIVEAYLGYTIKNALMSSQLGRGFKALIPDLYRRKVGLDVAEAQHLFNGLDCLGDVKDIHASINWLKANASYGVPSSELADPVQVEAPIQAHFGELENFVGFSDIAAPKIEFAY